MPQQMAHSLVGLASREADVRCDTSQLFRPGALRPFIDDHEQSFRPFEKCVDDGADTFVSDQA